MTGRGATVYRWRSSRHTWSHTHIGGGNVYSSCGAGGSEWANGSKHIKCGKDGNCCINIFTCTGNISSKNLRTITSSASSADDYNQSVCTNLSVCLCLPSLLLIKLHHNQPHTQLAGCSVCVCVSSRLPAGYGLIHCLIS